MSPPVDLRRANRHNLAALRAAPLAEVSGALGDLGTLLPLMIALAVQGSVSLDATLVFSGLFNVLTGVVFGVPLPVQPMKVNLAPGRGTGSSVDTGEGKLRVHGLLGPDPILSRGSRPR